MPKRRLCNALQIVARALLGFSKCGFGDFLVVFKTKHVLFVFFCFVFCLLLRCFFFKLSLRGGSFVFFVSFEVLSLLTGFSVGRCYWFTVISTWTVEYWVHRSFLKGGLDLVIGPLLRLWVKTGVFGWTARNPVQFFFFWEIGSIPQKGTVDPQPCLLYGASCFVGGWKRLLAGWWRIWKRRRFSKLLEFRPAMSCKPQPWMG